MVGDLWNWLGSLEWVRFVPELLGKFLGFSLGFLASWLLLFRKRLKALERLKRGDSDDVLFQAHFLSPVMGTDEVTILFRNVAPPTTLEDLYDNPAARDLVRQLADQTSLENPVLETSGSAGFEVLNDAFGHLAGHLATSTLDREIWLFAMTCEDRQVVRRKCVRCFLIRPSDLTRFANWDWCREKVRCEQPWHWYRIVALHQIAKAWRAEEMKERSDRDAGCPAGLPLVDEQARHRRVRSLSAGVFDREVPVREPVKVPWAEQEGELRRLGLELSAIPASGEGEVGARAAGSRREAGE